MEQKIGFGIDTTFDDTSVAILEGNQKLLANLTLSQYKEHERFGGVVPERASRKHLEVIHPLMAEALRQAKVDFQDLGYVCVSHKPGLIGSILVGLSVAKSLSYTLGIPLIGVNHIESHPYANFLHHGEIPFPVMHLVVAGGHTLLILAKDHFNYQIVGRSIDDAAGECMDKVAKMFGHGMPGGAFVDQCAMNYTSSKYSFPKPLIQKDNLNFSFSGLKTAMLYFLRDHPDAISNKGEALSSFFQSIIDVLLHKTFMAMKQYRVHNLTLSGGVAASQKLRESFQEEAYKQKIQLWVPPPQLATDNAAMVTCLASYKLKHQHFDSLNLEAQANLSE